MTDDALTNGAGIRGAAPNSGARLAIRFPMMYNTLN